MEKETRHVPQIKLFFIGNDTLEFIEKEVNQYAIECYSKHGNTPEIRMSNGYISVVCEKLVETSYGINHKKREIPVLDTSELNKAKYWWR
jgi:hypothetical protein